MGYFYQFHLERGRTAINLDNVIKVDVPKGNCELKFTFINGTTFTVNYTQGSTPHSEFNSLIEIANEIAMREKEKEKVRGLAKKDIKAKKRQINKIKNC